jgi:acyl-CoA thioester hydrolase
MTLVVRFCETDLMGIVHHANYLVYFEAGRVHWLRRRGVRYEEWARRGIHLPVVESRARYRKAARFDETLTVTSTCFHVTRVTARFGYVITRDEDRICEGETLLACVGPDLAPLRFPADVADIFKAFEVDGALP